LFFGKTKNIFERFGEKQKEGLLLQSCFFQNVVVGLTAGNSRLQHIEKP